METSSSKFHISHLCVTSLELDTAYRIMKRGPELMNLNILIRGRGGGEIRFGVWGKNISRCENFLSMYADSTEIKPSIISISYVCSPKVS